MRHRRMLNSSEGEVEEVISLAAENHVCTARSFGQTIESFSDQMLVWASPAARWSSQ